MSIIIRKISNSLFESSRFVQSRFINPEDKTKTNFLQKSVGQLVTKPSFLSVNSSFNSSEFLYRRIGNKFIEIKYKDLIKQIHSQISKINSNSADYIKASVELARFFCQMQPIETDINLQSGKLENIVNSDEACIFIMNHDYQAQDPVLMSIFGVLLYEGYLEANKGDICPRLKILINKNILTTKEKRHREIYEALGAVGVDVGMTHSLKEAKKNAKVLLSVISNFCEDKNHIFVFPEGRMAAFKSLDLKKRFQAGVGHIVKTATKMKGRVKVVPLGFAYDPNKSEKQPLGSIYIGEPVYFKRNGREVLTTIGNISYEEASDTYKKFFYTNKAQYVNFNEMPFKVITDNGIPVTNPTQELYIADILAENLQLCRKFATENLPKSSLGAQVQLC